MVYPYSGTPVKHPAALNPILRGQDMALGRINKIHILWSYSSRFQNSLYIFFKSFGYGVMLLFKIDKFDPDTLYNVYIMNCIKGETINLFSHKI